MAKSKATNVKLTELREQAYQALTDLQNGIFNFNQVLFLNNINKSLKLAMNICEKADDADESCQIFIENLRNKDKDQDAFLTEPMSKYFIHAQGVLEELLHTISLCNKPRFKAVHNTLLNGSRTFIHNTEKDVLWMNDKRVSKNTPRWSIS